MKSFSLISLLLIVSIAPFLVATLLIEFGGQIGFFQLHKESFIPPEVGAMLVYLFFGVPIFITLFLRFKRILTRVTLATFLIILPWVLLSASYSIDPLGPYPIKFWFRDPTNYEECREMQRAPLDTAVAISIERCTWVARGGYITANFYNNKSFLSPEKLLIDVDANKPYLQDGDVAIDMRRGETRIVNLRIVDPLKRRLRISWGEVSPVNMPHKYIDIYDFSAFLISDGVHFFSTAAGVFLPNDGSFSLGLSPQKSVEAGDYDVGLMIYDAEPNLFRNSVKIRVHIRD